MKDKTIMINNNSSKFISDEGNGQAIREIKNQLPELNLLVGSIQAELETLPTCVIEDYSTYLQVKERYEEKDLHTSQAATILDIIMAYYPDLENEIERCKANIEIIQSKSNELEVNETLEKMSIAEEIQENQLFNAEQLNNDMKPVIQKATKVISLARSKVCPPYIPPLKTSPMARLQDLSATRWPFGQSINVASQCTPYSSETILNDLINLGPVKKIT